MEVLLVLSIIAIVFLLSANLDNPGGFVAQAMSIFENLKKKS